MIAHDRLGELDALLSRLAASVPGPLHNLFAGLVEAGFNRNEALQITLEIVQSVVAVPAPVEQVPTPGR